MLEGYLKFILDLHNCSEEYKNFVYSGYKCSNCQKTLFKFPGFYEINMYSKDGSKLNHFNSGFIEVAIIRKNGKKSGKQNHICVRCGRQFIDSYEQQGYSEEIKKECLEMYVNGSGFRAIQRVKKVHHTTVINWVKELGKTLPDSPECTEIPEIAQVDELETFVGKKKQNLVVDSSKQAYSRSYSLGFRRPQF